ncbi:MAG: recombination protein NinG [Pseudomonadales bacterium]|nr:recombination protein NinG [Pseudomonadales bacterium]
MAKRKPKTVGKLKKELWALFAKVMKLRYSEDGRSTYCYTCGASIEIGTSNCQLGHWLPKGGYPRHYFTENNVRPQCHRCNCHLSGNSEVFRRGLILEIGEEAVNDMYDTRHEVIKRSRTWYEEQIARYKQELKEAA